MSRFTLFAAVAALLVISPIAAQIPVGTKVVVQFSQPSTVDPPKTTFTYINELRTQTDLFQNINGSLLLGSGPLDDTRGTEYHWGVPMSDPDPYMYALEVFFYSPLKIHLIADAPMGYTPWHVIHLANIPAFPNLQRFFLWMDPNSPGGRMPISNNIDPGFPMINQSFGLLRAHMLSADPGDRATFEQSLFFARPLRFPDVPVPEPSAVALVLCATLGAVALFRKRR